MRNVTNVAGSTQGAYDVGMRTYMNNIFKYMSIALLVTAVVGFVVSRSVFLLKVLFFPPIHLVVSLSPLFYVFYFSAKIWTMSPERARNNLWIYSGLVGLSLTSIFLAYTNVSLFRTFVISAATFAGMSLYGNTTKRDLTGIGSFLIMGLFGIFIASLVNIFLRSSGVEFITSVIGIFIFTGLTAYDVQRLKATYSYVGVNSDAVEKVAVIGALNLYMDFINLFLALLRFFGESRRD